MARVWGGGWKLGLLGAAARRQGGSRCVCSDGGAVWRALCCAGGGAGAAGGSVGGAAGAARWSNRRSRSTQSTRRGSLTLACDSVLALRSSARLMAAICLPGEVRRPVPGCYLPGGALGVLSVGADASLRAAHCFNIAWISFSSFSWICASQHSSFRNQRHLESFHSSFSAVWRMPLGSADSASSCFCSAKFTW